MSGNNSFNLQLNINPQNIYLKSIYFKLTSFVAVGSGQDQGIDLLRQYGFGGEGKLGHLTIGQLASSNDALRINPAEIGINKIGLVGSSTYHLQQVLPPLVAVQILLSPGLWSDQYGYGIHRKYMPKISYITPLIFDSFYAGLSYAFNKSYAGIFEHGKKEFEYENTLYRKNVLQAGIRYIKQISNNTDISASIVGEYVGSSRAKNLHTSVGSKAINTKIPAFYGVSLGAKLGYLGWKFAAEYGHLKRGKQIVVGSGYAIGPFAFGLSYMKGDGVMDDIIWHDGEMKINNHHDTLGQNIVFERKYKVDRLAITANYKQSKRMSWYSEIFSGKVRCDSGCNSITHQDWWCKNYGNKTNWKNTGIGLGVTITM